MKQDIAKLLGKMKVWQQRLATYVGMLNFAMLFYLFIIENKWMAWYVWLVIVTTGIVTLVVVDTKIIMPHSLAYNFEKNREWNRLMDEIEELKEMIKHGNSNRK
jgi:hypothetical protein